jgi:hypothetical protein
MGLEKWLAITSVALFAMFAGEMISVYHFMTDIPEEIEFSITFQPDPKIIQFVSIGVAPAGILAAVTFIMSRHYGSKTVGGLIIAGGIILFAGMTVSYSMLDSIDEKYLTDAVKLIPLLFMVLSAPVIGVGAYLIKHKKLRPKKEYF